FVSFVAMIAGALNTVKIYGTAATGQIAMNIALIIGAILASGFDDGKATVLAWFVLIGGFAQILVQIKPMKQSGFVLRPTIKFFTPLTRKLLRLMFPAVIGAAVYQISIFLNTLLASLLNEGSVSWLFYADRLVQLPIGTFSVALATVLLPALSKSWISGSSVEFAKNLTDALRYTSFIVIPISFGLYFFAEPIVKVLFERGEFTSESTFQTARAIEAFCFGMWGMSCHSMVVRGFLAMKDTKTPTYVAMLMLFVGFISAISLMGGIRIGSSGAIESFVEILQQALYALPIIGTYIEGVSLGHAGLALGSSIGSTFGFICLVVFLRARNIDVDWISVFSVVLKTIVASILMILGLKVCAISTLAPLKTVLLACFLGPIIFVIACFILRLHELKETFELFSRIASRRRNK
ncbi:MAG: oligosaccharide flippase family protein, partial [Bdellovibrionales bacterium]|nr:oligosaccharide flippase family protein [Bdellovibrionales bacterium]